MVTEQLQSHLQQLKINCSSKIKLVLQREKLYKDKSTADFFECESHLLSQNQSLKQTTLQKFSH